MSASVVIVDDESSVAFNVAHAIASLGWTPVVHAPTASFDVSGLTHVVFVTGRAPAASQSVIEHFVGAHLGRMALVGIGDGALALAVSLGLTLTEERPIGPGVVEVCHDGCLSFGSLNYRFRAWTPRLPHLDPGSLPPSLAATATTPTGALLAFRGQTHPCEGVFFHPESSGTPDGLRWFANVFGVRT